DALALHEALPDTVFFSMYEMTDPFPAPVLPLADFPRLAPGLGVTDVYGVFLDFMSGVLGIPRPPGHPVGVADGLDLSGVLRRYGMRTHALLYPGGGLLASDESLDRVAHLVDRADQVFSYVTPALERFPSILPIDPATIDTDFYGRTSAVELTADPVQLLFAADAKPRKGLDVALAAQRLVDRAGHRVHLTVAGPNEASADQAGRSSTFVGWQSREQLRELHRGTAIFLSPVRAERGDEIDGGITDGFPTTAAAEAMSSGCLLITANPEHDHRSLRPGVDYLEREPTPEAFADAIGWAIDHPEQAAAIAASGAQRVRERLDVRAGALKRLELMGFEPATSTRRG
ncbi:MAG: glycosyltransferase, partial [Solirubrobacteraceae bacterium]|nr:glycosyltransferase [Solirubrobacteraceae bacterium]